MASWQLAVIGSLLLLLAGGIYRVYFGPLAKFPGRKLAALTLWYEFYYDVVKRGQYTFEIQRMHQQYGKPHDIPSILSRLSRPPPGPIIRISPTELHVSDPDFYDELYSSKSAARDKCPRFVRMFSNEPSVFGSVTHDVHRMRRAPLNPFFSRQAIQRLLPSILSRVTRLCERLEEMRGTGRPVKMDDAYSALTMDVITEYCFKEPYGCLDDPAFMPQWPRALIEASEASHVNKQFGWLMPVMMALPEWLVAKMNPNIMAFLVYRKVGCTVDSALESSETARFVMANDSLRSWFLRWSASWRLGMKSTRS